MNFVEEALLFPCAGETLAGIVARPVPSPAENGPHRDGGSAIPAGRSSGRSTPVHPAERQARGVLIVVGGPQYRVGSHRQFLLLSRRLASEGYPVMRFDCRGMGDASGAMRSFQEISTDIGAAIEAFQSACPSLRQVVLWGLCDAASAALLYVSATRDRKVAGLVLLNPWVRSEASLAQTRIKHYYGQRLLQPEFWRKLLSGRMHLLKSTRDLLQTAIMARRPRAAGLADERRSFQDRMADGWREFSGKILLILSSNDYTAKEFLEFSGASPAWSGLLAAANVRRIDLSDADHTFSSQALRSAAEGATLAWLDTQEWLG